MEKEIYLARKINAQAIAEAIEQETASIIGRHESCRFLTEDQYWCMAAINGRYTLEEIYHLLDAVNADKETRLDAIPDVDSTLELGRNLCRLLLKRALKADWECEMIYPDGLWLLNYQETSPKDSICDNI